MSVPARSHALRTRGSDGILAINHQFNRLKLCQGTDKSSVQSLPSVHGLPDMVRSAYTPRGKGRLAVMQMPLLRYQTNICVSCLQYSSFRTQDNQSLQTYKGQKGEDSLPLYKVLVHAIDALFLHTQL